jgi:16S rRNA (guanine966-N2)-methyltransferase
MRIISGKFKGHPIVVPRQFKGRPTTDFARESLFNVLHHQIDLTESRVLELFAGTGAFSLECFSRGAEHLVAVELNAEHTRGIVANAKKFEASGLRVIKGDAFAFLGKIDQPFDLIFCDPPYDHPRLPSLPDLIFSHQVLAQKGLAIVEHPGEISFDGHAQLFMHRNYGHVHFSFFRHSSS